LRSARVTGMGVFEDQRGVNLRAQEFGAQAA